MRNFTKPSKSPKHAAFRPRREAFATSVVAQAIAENGIEAAQYQVALKQVEALTAVGNSEGNQTVILPANALDAFADAFKMLKGRG